MSSSIVLIVSISKLAGSHGPVYLGIEQVDACKNLHLHSYTRWSSGSVDEISRLVGRDGGGGGGGGGYHKYKPNSNRNYFEGI